MIPKEQRNLNESLLSMIIHNNEKVSVRDLERMLDDMVIAKRAYPILNKDNGTVKFSLEPEHSDGMDNILDRFKTMFAKNSVIMAFTPTCDCGFHMEKLESKGPVIGFKCTNILCDAEYEFEVVSRKIEK